VAVAAVVAAAAAVARPALDLATYTQGSHMTPITKISASIALMLGLAAPAMAGPEWTFGPNNEGSLQLDYKGQLQLVVKDIGSGTNDDETSTNFNFRRNRLALMGDWGPNYGLYVQTEYVNRAGLNPLGAVSGDDDWEFSILDAQFIFVVNDAFKINAGKFKYSFSRENLEACEMPLTLDRSLFLTAPLMGTNPTRDIGVSAWGNLFSDRFQYRFDVMEGRRSDSNAPSSNFRYNARMHVSLLDPETRYGYRGTYMGEKKVLTLGAAAQYEPDVIYGDIVAKTNKKDYFAWTVDGYFEYPVKDVGTVTLSSAYVKYDLDHAYLSGNPDPKGYGLQGEKNGWYAKAGYMLPKMPLQFFGRYEQWKFAQLNNIYNQKVDWAGLGANYYFRGQNTKVTAEYSKTSFDKEGTVFGVRSKDFSTFVVQLQVIF
jgi:hypothetical protein